MYVPGGRSEYVSSVSSNAGSAAPFSLSAEPLSQTMLEFVTPAPAWDVTMTSILVSGVSVKDLPSPT